MEKRTRSIPSGVASSWNGIFSDASIKRRSDIRLLSASGNNAETSWLTRLDSGIGIFFSLTLKVMATPLAGANVERGLEVKSTCEHREQKS